MKFLATPDKNSGDLSISHTWKRKWLCKKYYSKISWSSHYDTKAILDTPRLM